ncbi:MAG: hypothetical protein ABSB84_15530 [Verrucomicrobiota bacterium]|jgi:hypothetical protein
MATVEDEAGCDYARPKSDSGCPDTASAEIRILPEATIWKQKWILRISLTAATTYAISLNDGDSLSPLAGQQLTRLKIFEDFSCLDRPDNGKNIHRIKKISFLI